MVKGTFLDKMKSPTGKTMISILWGLGIACLFFKACKNESCINFIGPKQDEVLNKKHTINNECYNFSKENIECTEEAIEEIKESKK